MKELQRDKLKRLERENNALEIENTALRVAMTGMVREQKRIRRVLKEIAIKMGVET